MYSKPIEINVTLESRPIQTFNGLSSKEIMNRILSQGYQKIILEGLWVNDFSSGVLLFVEQDAEFLVDYYKDLENFLKTENTYQHHVFLNDGLLTFAAISNRTNVEIEFSYCPALNIANLINHKITTTEKEYILWWRNIAHEIWDLSNKALSQ